MAEGSRYDKEAADAAVTFINCLKHTKGEWYGMPFELIDWQEQIVRDIFGILKPNGYRQFNTAYIEIPKKSRVRANLQRQLLYILPAVISSMAARFTDVHLTVSRHPSFSMLQ